MLSPFQHSTPMVEFTLTEAFCDKYLFILSKKEMVRRENFTMDILSMGDVQLEKYITKIMLDIGVPD